MVTLEALLDSLVLEPVAPDEYRAGSIQAGHGGVFGGQLLAQSLVAGALGHEDKTVKTLHTVFVRAASAAAPLDISVEPMHRGRGFASSTVSISQDSRLCVRSVVLLSADEPDLIRHADRPAVGCPPEAAADAQAGAWDIHVAGGVDVDDPEAVGPAELDVWTRFAGAPDDAITNQALLAFASDFFLIGTAMRPHRGIGQAQAHKTVTTGVIGHTLTFHEPFSVAQWMLLSHRSPYAGRGRSYGRADVFQGDGALVASFVQDNMIRAKSGVGG